MKWLICVLVAAALITGLIVYLAQPTLYRSEAKLLVRWVGDTKPIEAGSGYQVQQPSNGAEATIKSEVEILTSFDLCEKVAALLGANKILERKGGSNNTEAAVAIYKGLTVENPSSSSIIKVRFVHPDPVICQQVLRQLIEAYFTHHKSIHRNTSSRDDVLAQQQQSLLIRIRTDEEELRKLNSQAGVPVGSLEDTKKSQRDRVSRLLQEFEGAEAQVAENRSKLGNTDHEPARLEWKLQLLSNQLSRVRVEIAELNGIEPSILEIQGRLQLNRQNYQRLAALIEAARFDEALGEGKMSNIQVVQTPSPSALNVSPGSRLAGTFFGFSGAGHVLALAAGVMIGIRFRRPKA